MAPKKMKALVVSNVTPAMTAKLTEVAVPETQPGWTLVHVRGFGMNHSEQVLRLEEIRASYIKHPVIPGIECVGEVADASDSGFAVGQRVCALMGGMGRNWDGSYAEYCLVRNDHLFAIPNSAARLSWDVLAAIPETFFTAWGSLFECLKLQKNDTLVVRGASCGLGYAALQIAHALGCGVVATTHREKHRDLLVRYGADEVVVDAEGRLAGTGIAAGKVLELIGPKTLRDSLELLSPGGICCHTGILGGLESLSRFDPITAIPNGCYLTGFYSNYPTQETMSTIYDSVVEHDIEPFIARVFSLDDLTDALAYQDNGSYQGKIVVVNEDR